MGMRQVPSDVGGANSFAVADQNRRSQVDRYADCGRSGQKLRDEAEIKLDRHPFIAVDGRPCLYAIEALVALWRRHGHSSVTPAMVQRAWLGYLSHPALAEYVAEQLPHLRRLGAES